MVPARLVPVGATFVALVLALVAVQPAGAADAPSAPASKALTIGDTLPGFEAKDLDGKTFRLADARTVSAEDALAAAIGAAKAAGATGTLSKDTPLASIPALAADEGGLHREKLAALVGAAGRPYGFVANAASVAGMNTLGDVAAFVERAASAPLVLVCWSPKCPTSRNVEERLFKTIAHRGARVYALACNATDAPDELRAYVESKELPLRVLLDAEQKVTDVLGGKRTPHVFVFDPKHVLRYAGAVDSDPNETEPEDKRIAYLDRALEALGEGRLVDILMTGPVG